ncbi:MAG: EamA family transporter [Desulfonatronovibrionaceae bacterium]
MTLAYLALVGRILLLGVERIVVKKMGSGSDCMSAAFLFFFIGAFFVFPFTFLEDAAWLEMVPRTLSSGVFYSLAFILYVKSLSLGEASLVSPLYNFNVFFLALLAAFFLDENLGIQKILALILLVYGASFLHRGRHAWESLCFLWKDKACIYMMAASLLIAAGRVIDKAGMASFKPVTYCCVLYFCISLYIFLYIAVRQKTGEIGLLLRTKPGVTTASGMINGFSYLFLLFALTGLDVSVAEPLSMLGILVTLVLSSIVFREKIGFRLIGASIMIAGAWILVV